MRIALAFSLYPDECNKSLAARSVKNGNGQIGREKRPITRIANDSKPEGSLRWRITGFGRLSPGGSPIPGIDPFATVATGVDPELPVANVRYRVGQ
jgi:hypothetical protein